MIKKIIILVFLIFLTCGCKVTVNIELDSNNINEEIVFTDYETLGVNKSTLKENYRNFISIYKDDLFKDMEDDVEQAGITYYTKKVSDINKGIEVSYSHKFGLKQYNKASSINTAFKSFNILRDEKENKITLSTDKSGIDLFELYENLESVTINIKPLSKVIDANTKPNNGIYSWTFNRYDNNKNIYIVVENKAQKLEEKKEEQDKISLKDVFLIVGGIFLFAAAMIIFIFFRAVVKK